VKRNHTNCCTNHLHSEVDTLLREPDDRSNKRAGKFSPAKCSSGTDRRVQFHDFFNNLRLTKHIKCTKTSPVCLSDYQRTYIQNNVKRHLLSDSTWRQLHSGNIRTSRPMPSCGVRLSVCLSNSCVLSKLVNTSSKLSSFSVPNVTAMLWGHRMQVG